MRTRCMLSTCIYDKPMHDGSSGSPCQHRVSFRRGRIHPPLKMFCPSLGDSKSQNFHEESRSFRDNIIASHLYRFADQQAYSCSGVPPQLTRITSTQVKLHSQQVIFGKLPFLRNEQELKKLDFYLSDWTRLHQNQSQRAYNPKRFWGACPQTPLNVPHYHTLFNCPTKVSVCSVLPPLVIFSEINLQQDPYLQASPSWVLVCPKPEETGSWTHG